MVEGGTEVERCASTASTTASLGGAAQRGLGGGRVLMDSRRAGALSGVVATSTAGQIGRASCRERVCQYV